MTYEEELLDAVARLEGWPPYDAPNNIQRGDGYYGVYLERKYNKPYKEILRAAKKLRDQK